VTPTADMDDLTLTEAAGLPWEVVVVGGGPAGAMAAYSLARAGARVLLVEKARFPRRKVCGCCFNPAALSVLEAAGLGDIPRQLGAPYLHTFHWAVDGRFARIPLPGGFAMSREAFDNELLRRARAAGVAVLEETTATVQTAVESSPSASRSLETSPLSEPAVHIAPPAHRGAEIAPSASPEREARGCAARVDPLALRSGLATLATASVTSPGAVSRNLPTATDTGSRIVQLRQGTHTALGGTHKSVFVRAGVVIVADGLGGRAIEMGPGFQRAADRSSRIGAGTIAPAAAGSEYQPGVVHMACARGGYVGLVRLEDGRLDVAGAFDVAFVRSAGGPGHAAAEILRSTGLPSIEGLPDLPWLGTPWLTVSRPQVADERLLVVGDAAGYVEPFTGEGLAWGLASGAAVVPIALEAIEGWRPELAQRWTRWYLTHIRPRQRWCRLLTRSLRRPHLMHWTVRMVAACPALARPLVKHLTNSVD
jgi:2-polyprenyl-6-methoxyphenol hydroxylase-like FAD-dependent oxidoreductase